MATVRTTIRREEFEKLLRGEVIQLPGIVQNVEILLEDMGSDKIVELAEQARDELATKASGQVDKKDN